MLALLCHPWVCFSQAATQAAPSDPYRAEPLVFERLETTYRMHADGTGERDLHAIVRIQSEGAAQQFSVLAFPYAAANETPHIKTVRVIKAGGATVETPSSNAIDMPSEVTREAPLYSDLKQIHLPVRSLSAGDKLEYEVDTSIDKAEASGQFWGAYHFAAHGTQIVLAEVLALEVPAEKYVQAWSPNYKPVTAEHDGVRTYTWTNSQLVPAPKNTADDASKTSSLKDPDEDGDGRKLPSVAWTTFHSWKEVGEWYRGLSLSQAKPNEALKTRADELTANAKTPEDQVRAIYDFVAAHTRYVGIDFGIGRYQPHTAQEVLSNEYGDCKDKDTLLEALLHAKGFGTAPVLVGVGIALVPEAPSPAEFNHVITTVNLPGGRIWLDSTPPAAPFQYLMALIRDQKVLVVPAEGDAELVSTPALPPYPLTERFEAEGTLDEEGKMSAKMKAAYRDDSEILVRAVARNLSPGEWDKGSQFVSSSSGFSGTTSNTKINNADDPSAAIELTYDYSKHPFGDWSNLRIIPLFPVVAVPFFDSDATAPEEDIQLGAPRTLTAVTRIHLPKGYRPDFPDSIHVKTEFATIDKVYRFEGGDLVVDRTVAILKSKVAKTDWKKYQTFIADAGLNSEAWIQLLPPASEIGHTASAPAKPVEHGTKSKEGSSDSVTAAAAATPTLSEPQTATVAPESDDTTANATPAELVADATAKLQARDWSGAKKLLDKAKEKNPNERALWYAYGFIAEYSDRNYEDAKSDFLKELKIQPDNASVVGELAGLQVRTGDSTGARQTLHKYAENHPENARISLYLASLQTNASDFEGALKTLEAASEKSPDDRQLRIQVSQSLTRLDRKQEAAAAAKSALDGAEDPGTLNDAAYALSLTGSDLDVAEEASRKSVAKLEQESGALTTGSANSLAFRRANLLIASWDTLGWILFTEGKVDAAQPLISAAWRCALHAEVGDHLAQIDEALGKKNEALESYLLAQAAGAAPPDVRTHIAEGIQRLKTSSAKTTKATGVQALQDLRTYKVARPAGSSGWGTFRLVIAAEGVIESQQMSGGQLEKIKPEIDAMKFPELFPPASKAHLLRAAVVSCSIADKCEVVFVPDGGLQTERE